MNNTEITISRRLKAIADSVSQGLSVVDVGCDHGFVSIYLILQKISPRVLAMDVRTGPLSKAREHVREYGLEKLIDLRISDGLKEFNIGEAQAMVCAGMGGPLMCKILSDSEIKAHSLKEMILQPQSELPEFRDYLDDNNYEILDEDILLEDEKYYFIFKVRYNPDFQVKKYNRDQLERRFGRLLLYKKHPVLKDYLQYRLGAVSQIEKNLLSEKSDKAQGRLVEIREELSYIEDALKIYN